MALRWLTTNPNPRSPATGHDAGQRGWKLHAVDTSPETTLFEARSLPAACGLRPRHGWGLDMFIDEPCKRCRWLSGQRPAKPDKHASYLTARYAGRCRCGAQTMQGDTVLYDHEARCVVECPTCKPRPLDDSDYLTSTAKPSRLAAMLAAKKVADAIVEAVAAAGPMGAPGGHIYAALMAQGCTLEQYETFMAALCKTGKLRRSGELYFVVGQ